jgi:hypothetical protein
MITPIVLGFLVVLTSRRPPAGAGHQPTDAPHGRHRRRGGGQRAIDHRAGPNRARLGRPWLSRGQRPLRRQRCPRRSSAGQPAASAAAEAVCRARPPGCWALAAAPNLGYGAFRCAGKPGRRLLPPCGRVRADDVRPRTPAPLGLRGRIRIRVAGGVGAPTVSTVPSTAHHAIPPYRAHGQGTGKVGKPPPASASAPDLAGRPATPWAMPKPWRYRQLAGHRAGIPTGGSARNRGHRRRCRWRWRVGGAAGSHGVHADACRAVCGPDVAARLAALAGGGPAAPHRRLQPCPAGRPAVRRGRRPRRLRRSRARGRAAAASPSTAGIAPDRRSGGAELGGEQPMVNRW